MATRFPSFFLNLFNYVFGRTCFFSATNAINKRLGDTARDTRTSADGFPGLCAKLITTSRAAYNLKILPYPKRWCLF